ncbi:uncharacterized protein K441DRAFT_656104 [Cenococcum geophilum 1.58]|uniref:uncharacterized protein n=1 Tax=Cenococcum geophilum 1.58 TaxID=794803 RepID=UPI00358DF535|nr:hypothetical protein K441DRAFT_656104 [Cenococcum geophilum 1.58]
MSNRSIGARSSASLSSLAPRKSRLSSSPKSTPPPPRPCSSSDACPYLTVRPPAPMVPHRPDTPRRAPLHSPSLPHGLNDAAA